MKLWFGLLVLVTGCMRAPMLRNAWRPDPAVVAGASVIAATVTLMFDPEAHRRAVEQAYLDAMPEERPMRVTEVVTAEVLDRLDALQRRDQVVSR